MQNSRMASLESTPMALQSRPTSLAKVTLSACQELSMYFTISAVRRSVRINGALSAAYNSRTVAAARSSDAPITVFGG